MQARRESAGSFRRALHILLADDDAVNRLLLVRLMEKCGHTTVAVENGREVLIEIDRATFDLILMDVQMPEMDGIETTMAIRAREKETGAHLPILAVTAFDTDENRERCFRAGMDAFTVKPVNSAHLSSTIERLLHVNGHSEDCH